jgi:hypothetical protein
MKVFEKKALKKVLGPRKGDITGEWGEVLQHWCSLPNIARLIESGTTDLAGHAVNEDAKITMCRALGRKRMERVHSSYLGEDEK